MIPMQKRSLKTLVPAWLRVPSPQLWCLIVLAFSLAQVTLFGFCFPTLSWSFLSSSLDLIPITPPLVCINSGTGISLATHHKSILLSSSWVSGKNYLFRLKLKSTCHDHLTSGWLGLPNSMYFWCSLSTLLNNLRSIYMPTLLLPMIWGYRDSIVLPWVTVFLFESYVIDKLL